MEPSQGFIKIFNITKMIVFYLTALIHSHNIKFLNQLQFYRKDQHGLSFEVKREIL